MRLLKKQYDVKSLFCGIDNIHFVKVIRGKGFTFLAPNGKDTHGFILIRHGKMRYRFSSSSKQEQTDMILQTGDILFVPQDTSYQATYLEENTEILHARFDLIYGELPRILSSPYCFHDYQSEHRFKKLFDIPSPTVTEESRALWGIHRIYELMWLAVNSSEETPKKFQKLTPALDHLQKHYETQEKIGFYAELCRMSESGFRRLFTEYTGLSPIDYRNSIRLEEAKKLIETGEYLVEEAAMAVGFQNISFFCRSYRKKYGHTPLGGL